MEYCVSSWGDMRTAELAREYFALSDTIMGSNLTAFLTKSTIGITSVKKELKTSIVIRKLFVEILDSISFHFSHSHLFSYLYYHYRLFITCCQGIITNSLFQIVSWEYEPDTFKFPKVNDTPRQYTPDFKVFYENYHCAYHEVKGWDYPKGIKARERFNKYYPSLELILIGEVFFNNAVNNGLSKLIPNWEYYKYQNKKKETTDETL